MKNSFLIILIVCFGCATVQETVPLSSLATISADSVSIVADSSSSTRITVKTLGDVADSQLFTLTTDRGRFVGGSGIGNQSISIRTDGDSSQAILISGTTPGIAHVSATIDGIILSTSVLMVPPPAFNISLSSSNINANGISIDTIMVQLQQGTPDGQTVSFASSLGQFITPSGAQSNYQGKTIGGYVKALLSSGLQTGTAHLAITVGALTEYVDIMFVRQYPTALLLFPSAQLATADGTSAITLTVSCNVSDSLTGLPSSGLNILIQSQDSTHANAPWLDRELQTGANGTSSTSLSSKIRGSFLITASLVDIPSINDTVTLTFH